MNNMAQVLVGVGEEVDLVDLERGLGVVYEQKNFVNVVDILLGCLANDQDFIQVKNANCYLTLDKITSIACWNVP